MAEFRGERAGGHGFEKGQTEAPNNRFEVEMLP